MNERITIPENTRVIIDGDVIIFESKERELNKWYSEDGMHQMRMLNLGQGKCVGFIEGKWVEGLRMIDELNWQLMETEEVTRLLIGEAEKKYPKGTRFITPAMKVVLTSTGSNIVFMEEKCCLYIGRDLVFCNGKWAEIIPEKKPYINQYFTPFNEGEDFYWVHSDTRIVGPDIFDRNSKIDNYVLFMGTERECHQYLYENWDELNKNK